MNAAQKFEELTSRLKQFFVDAHSTQAIVALSGGIDSALVVALAVEALGADNVRVILLPSPFSSSHSVDDSLAMAKALGLHYDLVPIGGVYQEALKELKRILPDSDLGLACENIQSRIRCALTMGVSNATGALMLNTSNRSEILVGYGTLYGDTSGAVGVIASLYKGEVYELSRYINSVRGEVIPQNIIDKAPSAELREGQLDSDSLPDYAVLDPVLRAMVDRGESQTELEKRYPKAIVERVAALYGASAFKRMQLPPAL
ncbi:MAG: NAD(+) synthase [Mucinivorans sp.]